MTRSEGHHNITGVKSLLVAAAAFLALSLIFTYPLVLAPSKANRFDSHDAMLNAWILSWDLHRLSSGRIDVFDANIFYPEKNTLALSDNLLTAALVVLPLRLFTDNPILLVNMALLAALVTSALAAFVLARHFWGSIHGAALAGILFGFGSYHWGHLTHLQLQWTFTVASALYFARRIREGAGLPASLGMAVSVAATFGCSGYYAVYLLTALPLFVAIDFLKPTTQRTRAAVDLGVAGLLSVLFSLPLVLPYLSKFSSGHQRSVEAMIRYSADYSAYVSSASRLHFFLPRDQEALFSGFVGSGLALFALAYSFTQRTGRRDVTLWLLLGLTGVGLSMGPTFGPFSLLYRMPAYQGLRVPSRAGILFLLAVAVLAALGLSRIRSARLRLALLFLAAAECYAGPLYWSFEVPAIPPIYRNVRAEPGALIELPFPPPDQFYRNAHYMYRSTSHWKPLVNGYSGFVPQSYRDMHRVLMEEDFLQGVVALGDEGVGLLMAHTSRLGPRMLRSIAEAVDAGTLVPVEESGSDRLYRIASATAASN